MAQPLTAEALFETHKDKLLLDWLAGYGGKDRLIIGDDKQQPSVSLIGHLNAIHPNQIQVLGPWEPGQKYPPRRHPTAIHQSSLRHNCHRRLAS
jgi:serine kinase of HPr protein (carbohydrate metabolism regulator)